MIGLSVMDEERDAPSVRRLPDPICVAVGSSHYVFHHRLGDLYIETPVGRTPRLGVSRYYWELEPPLAVDFISELHFGELEIAAKKTYCQRHNIRYILVKDAYDGERAEHELARSSVTNKQPTDSVPGKKPLTGPRRRPRQST